MGLILNTLYSIIVFILLKSAVLVLGKNLTTKILTFIVLLFIKRSLVTLLKFNR